MLKISLQNLPESHFGCSSWLLLADAGCHKPGNPWFEQFLRRKYEVFHDLINFTQKSSRILARVAFICQLYERNLRATWISHAFLQASLHQEDATWPILAGAGHPKPGNPWFEQLLPRKHKFFCKTSFFLSTLRGEFEADIHSDRIFARIFARVALICQLYEGNLRLPCIPTAFLQASLHLRSAPDIRNSS